MLPPAPISHPRRAALALGLAAALLAGCAERPASTSGAPAADSAGAPPIALDDFGDTLPLRPYSRIVSLNPTTTEAAFALGGGPRLVGRSHWDQWPDSARALPDLGPALRPNVEVVLGARPDLVLLYASADNREAARRLRDAGVITATYRVDSIAQLQRLLPVLGVLLGDSARARLVRDSIAATLAAVQAATARQPRPRVVVPAWHSPLIVIGAGSHLHELVTIAGGENVYADLPASSPQVSLEDLLGRDPDVVLTSPLGRERILADRRWRALRAVRERRVLAFDTMVVGRPSVTLGAAAVSIAGLLHPGVELP